MLDQSEGVLPGEVNLGKYVFNELQNLSKSSAVADVYPARRIGEKENLLVLRRAKFGQDQFLAEEKNIRTSLRGDSYLREHMPLMEASGTIGGKPYILVERITDEDLIPVLDVAENLSPADKAKVASQILNIVEHWHLNKWLINDIGNGAPMESPIYKADRYILVRKAGRLTVIDLDANLAKKIEPFIEVTFTGDEKRQLGEYRRDIDAIKFLNSTDGRKKILTLCQQINNLSPQSESKNLERLKVDLAKIDETLLANGIYPEAVVNQTQDLWFIDGFAGDFSLQINDICRLINSLEQNNFLEVLTQIKKSLTKWGEVNPIFKENDIVNYIKTKISGLKSNLYTQYFPGRDISTPIFGTKVYKHTMNEVNTLTEVADKELEKIDKIPQEVLEQNEIQNNAILNEYQCVATILEKLLGSGFESQIQSLRTELKKLPISKDIHSQVASLIRKRLRLPS